MSDPLGFGESRSKPRAWRDYATFIGFIFAAISCVSMFGVMAYLGKVHLGFWREYEVASAWGFFMWPLSLLAFILGILGRGRIKRRILLGLSSCILLFVWTMALIR